MPKEVIRRKFSQTIDNLRRGALGDELDNALRDLVNQCRLTERKGQLILTLTIKPTKGQHFEVIDDVKLKAPVAEKGTTLMFPTPEGWLTRNDPQQADLVDQIREVDPGTGEIRTVA